jgi:hypothetical protein
LTQEDIDTITKIDEIKVSYVNPRLINVTNEGEGCRKTYQTLEQAMENKLGYVPSPTQLSKSINLDDSIKPVRIVAIKNKTSDFVYSYNLIEGRVRYWAWVMKFDNKPIPCLIRSNKVR